MKRHEIDPEWLRKVYLDESISITEIAQICKVSATCIHDWLKYFNIPTRSFAEAIKLRRSPGTKSSDLLTKEVLEVLYSKKKCSLSKIREIMGYSPTLINKYLDLYNLRIKKQPTGSWVAAQKAIKMG